ncbi:MAG: hypothetical protein M3A44_07815 [Gammaproteobacteria bacterium]
MKKSLSDEQFRSSLVVGHFARSADLPPPGDPVTVTAMQVPIDLIKPYDGNIRLVRNPKHDDLHHRIVTLGQEGESPITRRPGDAHFMIAKGGNTTLEIMHGLWKSGDVRFQVINCRFYPWTRESDVLAAHIAENEVRGDNTFIEKALALQTLRQRLEDETGETLGLREFVRRLADPAFKIGLKVSVTQMHRLQYAAQFLYPLLPEALRAGMGPRPVEALQKIESLYRAYWQKRGPAGLSPEAQSAEFDALFGAVLSTQDSPDFVIDELRPALEDQLASLLDRPLRSIQAEIAALSAGIDLGADIPPETDDEVTPPPAAPSESGACTRQHDYTGPMDVRSLRNRSYVLALRLAQRHGLAECVINSPRTGLGYLMDLPRDSLKTEQSRWVWWLLLSYSEQMVIADGEARVPPENRFGTLALGNQWEEIYALVERPKWVVMPSIFLCSPHTRDADFDDVMMLMQNTRRLRGLGDDATLWT